MVTDLRKTSLCIQAPVYQTSFLSFFTWNLAHDFFVIYYR